MTSEEKDEMVIWQEHDRKLSDHERRLAQQEAMTHNLFSKMDNIEKSVRQSTDKQEKLFNQLVDHHLSTDKMKLSGRNKIILAIVGSGGLGGIVAYGLFQLI